MVNTATARTIVGIAGNAISFGLFLSPMPTIWKICKSKSVQAYKPDPYVVTILNCAMWVFYGMPFVHPDSTLVITINGVGLVVEFVYTCVFLIYSKWPIRKKILLILLVEVIFLAAVVLVTMLAVRTTKQRTLVVGIICIVFNIGMYAAPLTIMKRVITTKSVKYMPFTLSLANLANGLVWLVYALLKFDINILVPNGLGTLSGLTQLVLYATYYKTTKWEEEAEQEKPAGTDIEVSTTANNNSNGHSF